jgi:hypothetical protein
MIDESLVEVRAWAEEIMAAHPGLREKFEAEYEQDKAFREQRGMEVGDRDGFLRGCALNHELRQRIRTQAAKLKPGDIAAAYGAELPPGWDDMLPPEITENEVR